MGFSFQKSYSSVMDCNKLNQEYSDKETMVNEVDVNKCDKDEVEDWYSDSDKLVYTKAP